MSGDVKALAADLLETDALTPNHDGTPEHYIVEADNVEYLVQTVLAADAARPCDHEAQIRDLLEEREELLTEIVRLQRGNHPAGRALRAVDRCPHDYAPCPFCPPDLALAEALTERDAEHEGEA